MFKVKFAILPGLVIGSLIIVFISNLVFPSEDVFASTETESGVQTTSKMLLHVEPAATDNCTLSNNYPEKISQWCNYIMASAEKHQLDPNFIAAVMLQESGGYAEAYSKSGAVGLMQIMPRDGIASQFMCKNGPCFASRPTMSELYDPSFNIDYGANMLAGLIQRHGNQRDALKAYGPMNMDYRYADLVLNIYQSY